jgi:diadenosine tetraphosphatase ApaH/serine/threonine PP2A family protein phosphatase
MRIAILADVHANLEALRRCLAHAAGQGVDRYAFLGDLVGYGADPVACLEIVAEYVDRGAIALMGNHDQAAVDGWCEDMNFMARDVIHWTREQLGDAHRLFLSSLPLSFRHEELLLVHAEAECPEEFRYVTNVREAARSLAATDARIVAAGHVHAPKLFHTRADGSAGVQTPVAGTSIPLTGGRQWFAIVGSCGQPRDGDPAAAYAILDCDQASIRYQRTPYDHATAAGKIIAAGLPEYLAARLAGGH